MGFVLNGEGCKQRQRRLLAEMQRSGWNLLVTSNYRTVYYFTGQLPAADAPCAFLAWDDGRTALLAPSVERAEALRTADEYRTVPVYSAERGVPLPHHDAASVLLDWIAARSARRVAVDRTSSISPCLDGLRAEDASAAILRLRRRKEADEVEEIRASLALCAVAYDTARLVLRPGLTELDVFLSLQNVIAQAAGAPVPLAGDFACGQRSVRGGGAATLRELQRGDLCPLDLFPAPALYFGDTCRTFCVGGEPTAQQEKAFQLACAALELGESLLQPGASARAIYTGVKSFLDDAPETGKSFWHHLGHGIGLHGHEAPRLVAESGDVLEPGDVLTIEPGIYVDAYQGGIRVENNYLITGTGFQRLFSYPLSLQP